MNCNLTSSSELSPAPATLADLPIGATGVVTELTLRGAERRRLLDLGLVPGTVVVAEMRSPLGDPVAYRVRGASVALRREQARQIQITYPENMAPDIEET
jgi:Fe2+ transport system protein FeoA